MFQTSNIVVIVSNNTEFFSVTVTWVWLRVVGGDELCFPGNVLSMNDVNHDNTAPVSRDL